MNCPGCPECLVCSKRNSIKTEGNSDLKFCSHLTGAHGWDWGFSEPWEVRGEHWTPGGKAWHHSFKEGFVTTGCCCHLTLRPSVRAMSHISRTNYCLSCKGWGLPCLSVGNMLTGIRLMLSEQFVILILLPRKEVNGSSHLSRWIILAEKSSLFSCESPQAVVNVIPLSIYRQRIRLFMSDSKIVDIALGTAKTKMTKPALEYHKVLLQP